MRTHLRLTDQADREAISRNGWNARFKPMVVRGAIVLAFFLGIVPIESTSAQVLDQAVTSHLLANCALLGAPGGSPFFGTNLNSICAFPATSSTNGTSAGGGAATVQSAAISILNTTLTKRLEQVRAEEGQEVAGTASFGMWNPFGLVMSGLSQTPGFAAAPSVGNGSGGTLNLGGNSRWKGLGVFATGLVEALDRDVTTFQDGFKSSILGLTGGADYRFSRQFVAGLAFTYTNTDGDFRNGGNFSTNSYGGNLFASLFPTDETFVQVVGGYTRNNYLVARAARAFIAGSGGNPDRNVSGLASSNADGDVVNVNVLLGYDQPIRNFTIGPRLGLNYSYTHILDFAESGGTGIELRYHDQYINSIQSVLGIQGSAAFSTAWGVLVPQVNADYIHEFANSQRFITIQFAEDHRPDPKRFTFQNEVPVRNYFNLAFGLFAVLPNGIQPFVNFRAMVGNYQFDNFAGTFGIRFES